nr:CREB binding protein [Hymenolepis microstoma]
MDHSNFANPLRIPSHGSITDVGLGIKPRVLRHFLRWLLHSLWCVTISTRRKACYDPRCIQLRPVVRHLRVCDKENCGVDYCKISKETKAHWDICQKIDCEICNEMYIAFEDRLMPDETMNPQPNPDLPMMRNERKHFIRKIIKRFCPNPDYSDMDDERLKMEILRARIIEGQIYIQSKSPNEYLQEIEEEIINIIGHP